MTLGVCNCVCLCVCVNACVCVLQPTRTACQIWCSLWRVSGWWVLAMTRVWAGCAPKVAACWGDTTSPPGPPAYSILHSLRVCVCVCIVYSSSQSSVFRNILWGRWTWHKILTIYFIPYQPTWIPRFTCKASYTRAAFPSNVLAFSQ